MNLNMKEIIGLYQYMEVTKLNMKPCFFCGKVKSGVDDFGHHICFDCWDMGKR
jgi:hypothetical protein